MPLKLAFNNDAGLGLLLSYFRMQIRRQRLYSGCL